MLFLGMSHLPAMLKCKLNNLIMSMHQQWVRCILFLNDCQCVHRQSNAVGPLDPMSAVHLMSQLREHVDVEQDE